MPFVRFYWKIKNLVFEPLFWYQKR